MTPLGIVITAIWIAVAGIGLSLLVPSAAGRRAGFAALLASGCASVLGAIVVLLRRQTEAGGDVALHVALRVDPLAAFFVLVIASVAVAVGLYGLGGHNADERRTGRTASAAACAIFFACLVICLANDTLLFIFGWEALALAFYWSIGYAGTDETGPAAAYFALVVTHAAGAGLVAGFFLCARVSGGSFAVTDATAGLAHATPALAGTIFVLLLIGFGAKVGMFPLHAWLRYGYPAAPSSVAALMAGGALNVGFYGLVRFLIEPQIVDPLWWGILVLALGALGALLGIAWAMSEADLRALAAYSSVENAGIILAALGAALVGRATHLPLLTGLALAAAFVQIAAHALAKALLFLGCSSVRNRVGSTSFGQLGGLARRLPLLTMTIFIAALSLAALPPLAGYAGEWLTLETLMQAFRTADVTGEVTFALCAAAIGIAAGIAVVAFVKFLGAGFLGAPRSLESAAATADRNVARGTALALLALALVAVGVGSPTYLGLIGPAVDETAGVATISAMVGTSPLVQPAFPGFSSTAPGPLIAVILGFMFVFWLIAQAFRRPATRRTPAWTSGEAYRAWTVYTGTGFANASRVILDAVTRVERVSEGDVDSAVGPLTYASRPQPFFDAERYQQVARLFLWISGAVRATQSGVIAAYLSYILVFTILLLLLYPSMRHW